MTEQKPALAEIIPAIALEANPWIERIIAERDRFRADKAELLAALKGARLFIYAQMGVAEKQGWPTDHFRQEIAECEAAIAKTKEE